MADPNTQPSPTPPPLRTSAGNTAWDVLIVLGGIVLGLALLAAFMLPVRAGGGYAPRAACMNNARQIGLAMFQYADDHNDYYPPLVDVEGKKCPVVFTENGELRRDLEALRHHSRSAFAVLLKEGYLTTTKVFICPNSKDRLPPASFPTDFKTANLRDLLLGENNCSYGWDPTKMHTADAMCAIVADKPRKTPGPEGTVDNNSENHKDEGQNIFYNDGHVRWATTPKPDAGSDPDIYTGSTEPGKEYWKSASDAKIIR